MTTTTEEYWDVNGTTLNTLAYNIESLNGRVNVPPFRGEDLTVAYRSGDIWRQKTPGSRTISLGMWVRDADVDGVVPSTDQARRAQLNDNIRALQRLFYSRTELTLTKRIRTGSGLLTVAASAQLAGQMEYSPAGYGVGRMVVDLKLADPFFYGSLVTSSNINVGAGFSTINNAGDDYTDRKLTVELYGTLVAPVLTNSTTGAIVSFPTITVTSPRYLVVDVEGYRAYRDDDSTVSYLSSLAHTGARTFFNLKPGNNSVALTATSGSGYAVLKWSPSYL